MDDDNVFEAYDRVRRSAQLVQEPLFALIVLTEIRPNNLSDLVIAICNDGREVHLCISPRYDIGNWVGELVIISERDEKLVRPGIASYKLFGIAFLGNKDRLDVKKTMLEYRINLYLYHPKIS